MLDPGAATFFDVTSGATSNSVLTQGAGSVTVGLDLIAASTGTNEESFASFGFFSGLTNFFKDTDLNTINSFIDDGLFVTLEFIPSLALTGQTLNGSLQLLNGEILSGSGTVNGILSGATGSSITASGSGLTIGNAASTLGVSYSGTMDVANSVITLLDANHAELKGQTTLGGGTLNASNGILLANGASLSGGGSVVGEFLGSSGSTVTSSGNLSVGDASSSDGFVTFGDLNVGAGTMTLLDANAANVNGNIMMNGGSLSAANGINVAADKNITGNGSVDASIALGANTLIQATTGNLALGNAADFNGFRTDGEIKTGSNTVALNSATFSTLGTVTTIGGGSLVAANGVFLGGGKVITGSGSIVGKVAAEAGSLINATGDLAIGDSSALDGYFSNGKLAVNNNTVTLNDANKAKLGSLTTIGDTNGSGLLEAVNGLVLNGGHNISGYGEVGADLENQGTVHGQGLVAADFLELSGAVTGAGDYTGNIAFSGTFMPGNSPALIEFENLTLLGLLDIEIGGLTPGSQYDVLAGTGDAFLGGTLDVSLINGFSPILGNSFDILTAQNIIGEFDLITFAVFDSALAWNLEYIIDGFDQDIVRLSIVSASAVPLPASIWLLGSGFIVLSGIAKRKKG
ncbi:MAG: VPLPA-CTERM sorting domain-containing protein [Thiotrichaceae bacterium]